MKRQEIHKPDYEFITRVPAEEAEEDSGGRKRSKKIKMAECCTYAIAVGPRYPHPEIVFKGHSKVEAVEEFARVTAKNDTTSVVLYEYDNGAKPTEDDIWLHHRGQRA